MSDFVIALISCGAVAALVDGIIKGIGWIVNRTAKRKDKNEEKSEKMASLEACDRELTERIASLESSQAAIKDGMKFILLDRILHLGQRYIECGKITFEQRRILHSMHDVYHNGLGGNGDADCIMKAIDSLPLNSQKEENI